MATPQNANRNNHGQQQEQRCSRNSDELSTAVKLSNNKAERIKDARCSRNGRQSASRNRNQRNLDEWHSRNKEEDASRNQGMTTSGKGMNGRRMTDGPEMSVKYH